MKSDLLNNYKLQLYKKILDIITRYSKPVSDSGERPSEFEYKNKRPMRANHDALFGGKKRTKKRNHKKTTNEEPKPKRKQEQTRKKKRHSMTSDS